MRNIVKSAIGHCVFMTLLASLTACGQASPSVTEWHGLCLPSERVASPLGGAFGEAFSSVKTDTSVAPEIVLNFSAKELAQAISGYKPNIPGRQGTIMAMTLKLQPLPNAAQPGGPAYLGQGDVDLWHLTGDWAGSSVTQVPSTDLYRVTDQEDQKYSSYFVLVTKDLQKTSGQPVPPLSEWFVASCGQRSGLGYTCNRALVTEGFYVEYNVAKPNVTKLPALDEFFRNKLKEWQAACESR
ncbi:MAG: hypothetical protein ACRDHZ_18350 [Ktedonobacteraceae bacterium]